MAIVDLTRKNGRHKKRDVSVAYFGISWNEVPDSGDIYEMINLPEHIMIVGQTVNVKTAFDSVTPLLDIGIDGSDVLGADIDLLVEGVTTTLEALAFNSSAKLTALLTFTGVASEGHVDVAVSYIELNKTTGELTTLN